MTKESAKEILKVLNNINSMLELKREKENIERFLEKEKEKPRTIEVKWVGCYELMRDGTKTTVYDNVQDFLSEEDIAEVKTNEEALVEINKYSEKAGLGEYSLREINKNLIEDIVEHYWENNRETMSFEVRYLR